MQLRHPRHIDCEDEREVGYDINEINEMIDLCDRVKYLIFLSVVFDIWQLALDPASKIQGKIKLDEIKGNQLLQTILSQTCPTICSASPSVTIFVNTTRS